MSIYIRDVIKYLLKKKKMIIGFFSLLFLIAFVLLTVESTLKNDVVQSAPVLSAEEQLTAHMYYQTEGLIQNISDYQNSIIMQIDCNNVWYMKMVFSYVDDDWEDKYAILNQCKLNLATYIDKAMGSNENGFEDIVQTEVEYIEDAHKLYFTVELYYYNEQGLLDMGECVKNFLNQMGAFELLDEFEDKISSKTLAQEQMTRYSWQTTLYNNQKTIKDRLTVNGEKYYNTLVNGETELVEEKHEKTIDVKSLVLQSVFIALGGVLIQCSFYMYLYISRLLREKKLSENEYAEK